MATTGHESEVINVDGLKASLQKLKTDIIDGKYSKPNGGIPSSDLAQAVQDLLTAASTALQASDLTTLNNKVTALEAYFSSEADADAIINKWNEIVAFLAGIAESQTLDGIISGINDSISAKYTKPSGGIPASDLASDVQDLLTAAEAASVAITLPSAPTSSTLTYTYNGKTFNFKVGDEVRVLDSEQASEGSNGYVYYKLYDITTEGNVKTAYWDLGGSGGGGGGATGKIRVELTAVVNGSQAAASTANGVTVTLTNTTDSQTVETKTWAGSQLVFTRLTPLKAYRISVSAKTGYKLDYEYQDIASLDIGGDVTKTFEFSAVEYTVEMTSNQDVVGTPDADVDRTSSGVYLTGSYSYGGETVTFGSNLHNGDTVRMPSDVNTSTIAISGSSNVTGYAKTTSVDTTNKKLIVAYSTTKVYLTAESSRGSQDAQMIASLTGFTINGTSVTQNDNTSFVKVPTGTSITVVYPSVTNYLASTSGGGTASGTTQTVNVLYMFSVLVVEVSMSDADDTELAKTKVYITVGSGTETEMTGTISNHVKTFSESVEAGATYSLRFGDVTGYATPAAMTGQTKGSGVETIQKVYNTTLLSVALASDTGEADLTNVTVTVTDTTASDTVTKSGNVYKIPRGNGYSVSVSDDVDGYKAPAAATGTASGTAVTVTMTYEEQAGFVDLGLPSGKKWAIGNIVKDSQGNYSIGEETDWGTYISWGNIIGHNEGEGYDFSSTNYDSTPGKQVAANIPSNDAAHDIALATLGTPWHLPTKEDFQELYDNTDNEWVADYNGTGVAGRKFMKKSDHSVYVFFPASGSCNGTSLFDRGAFGYYWSSSFNSATGAYRLSFNRSSVNPQINDNRRYGLSVRPVQ